VTLNSDDPLRACTTIGREYANAAKLGASRLELSQINRNAVRASFTTEPRRRLLLEEIEGAEAGLE